MIDKPFPLIHGLLVLLNARTISRRGTYHVININAGGRASVRRERDDGLRPSGTAWAEGRASRKAPSKPLP